MIMEKDGFHLEFLSYKETRRSHWNDVHSSPGRRAGNYYHSRLHHLYRHLIPAGSRVLELGCGTGNLLAAVQPSRAVGVDFSEIAILKAKAMHPGFEFVLGDVHDNLDIEGPFDYIILSDLINDLWDVQRVISVLINYCDSGTRIIFNFHSHLWSIPLNTARRAGLANKVLHQNWFTIPDLNNFFQILGLHPLVKRSEIALPIGIPGVSNLVNRYVAKLWPFYYTNFTNFVVARPLTADEQAVYSVSVIVAARNEEGHIDELVQRIPRMGSGTEIVFVEGNSTDNTFEAIKRVISERPDLDIKLFKQKGKGKGDAVRLGFEHASGDILMILDADITVPPEDLPRFYDLMANKKAEFVNGVRLVYPMQKEAMRFFNLIGNKLFSWAFTWLLGQPIRDTLCGTKVLWRKDYRRIAENRSYFGDFDPFGDFDLLFGAARLNLHIVEMPVRYRARTYGETNISRWKHGWLLLKMVVFAARRIKFI